MFWVRLFGCTFIFFALFPLHFICPRRPYPRHDCSLSLHVLLVFIAPLLTSWTVFTSRFSRAFFLFIHFFATVPFVSLLRPVPSTLFQNTNHNHSKCRENKHIVKGSGRKWVFLVDIKSVQPKVSIRVDGATELSLCGG